MWELFEAYRKSVKDNPRVKVEYVGRNGERVETPIERPLTIDGFKTFCAYQVGDINRYFYNVDNECDEYVSIIARIKDEIRAEQIDGAMVNAYNSNLTARINGLTEKNETKITGEISPFNPFDIDVPTDNSKIGRAHV